MDFDHPPPYLGRLQPEGWQQEESKHSQPEGSQPPLYWEENTPFLNSVQACMLSEAEPRSDQFAQYRHVSSSTFYMLLPTSSGLSLVGEAVRFYP